MTDLDNTQIITADDSLLQNSSTIDTEASLKIISGADSNTYQIGKETIIGRSNPSDLVISAPSLSKQHAKINFNNGQYFITDLGSSNKTFHNKVQLQPNVCYALHDGDEIKLGDIICLFEEHKSEQTNKNIFSETTDQTYIPVVNTLVEEDSPWPLDDDISSSPVITETNVDVIPSTQTISDSYDDEQPTQPMKIWNGNSNNNTNRLSRTNSDDVTPKQNGLASSFISPSLTTSNDVNDDNSLVIGAATLPATVPLVIESTQINNDDQLEIISSSLSQTKQVIEEDNKIVTIETTETTTTAIEIENTQAYTLEPVGETTMTSNNQITETQPYELESEPIVTDVVETEREEVRQVVIEGNTMIEEITTTTTTTTTIIADADNPIVQTLAYDLQPTNEETSAITTTTTVIENENPITDTLAYDLEPNKEPININETAPAVCQDTQEYDLDEQIEDSPRPASETLEVVPVSKLVEQLKEAENVSEDATPKHVEVIINPDVIKEVAAEEQMDTDQTDVPSAPINNESVAQTTNKIENEVISTTDTDEMAVDETEKTDIIEVQPTTTEPETTSDLNKSVENTSTASEQKTEEPSVTSVSEEVPPATLDTQETQQEDEGEGEEDQETDESVPVSGRGQRGVPRKAARRGRGRRGGAATRARVVSTRIHGTRRNVVPSTANDSLDNNATLEETVNTEPEESPQKSAPSTPAVELKSNTSATPITPTTPADETSSPSQTNSNPNIRVSARIKARASNGRNRQFPFTDDYVDLDDLEKQSKTANVASPSTTTTTTTSRRSNRGGRSSSAPQKRISLRQQPIDASESPDEKNTKQKDNTDVYEQMDTGGENEEPNLSTRTIGRKRKSTTPVASTTTTKRSRSTTPPTTPVTNTRRKQASITEQTSPSPSNTPKRGRKSTKSVSFNEQSSPEKPTISTNDRPVRIALSSHLNFDQNHLEALRKLGFEIMDESCQVDALVVDRIRRTKKFFMCLARGAHILSPTWIEAMIKENRYISYDKYYLEDTNAETRYGFQLRESVRLAKQRPIFENYKFYCTKDTSPPYDDLKDIVEAAGGKFIDKINTSKPGKDLICIVAQIHKTEYEDLYKKGVPIVSEEFALSGISKQKLDLDAFSLFQPVAATTMKTSGSK